MIIEEETFGYADEIGPEKIVYFHDPRTQLKAILVIDNTALGPAVGGVRMAPNVTTGEAFRLARAMTLKNAAAGIPFGGAKSALLAEADVVDRDEMLKVYARLLRNQVDYIPGPDMGTDEHCMAVMHCEIGRAAGLPAELGGIPLDEIGITGYGAAEAAEVAARFINRDLRGARVAIEGFGAVGQACFRALVNKGARIVAVSDVHGGVFDPEGLDFEALATCDPVTAKPNKLWNRKFDRGERISCAELFSLNVDVLVPGARPDVITMANVGDVKAWLVVEAANIPVSVEAESWLADHGVLVIPDFIANAGGVIAISVELRKGSVEEAFEVAGQQIRTNVQKVLEIARDENVLPRVAAETMARRRVLNAMRGDRVD